MADDRKARLKALAARAGRTKETNDGDDATGDKSGNSTGAEQRSIAFRNYAPIDTSLSSQQQQLEEAGEESEGPSASKKLRTDSNNNNTPMTSSEALQNALEEAQRDPVGSMQAATSAVDTTATVTNMAPKKINWDLKRDISDKLAKLERRTQKALVRILKERLESEAAEDFNDDDINDEEKTDLD